MISQDLIDFEKEISDLFNAGQIRSPVHLSGGNEGYLIKYFEKRFNPGDWVFTTWRSHYHCLLAGVPPEQVKVAILAGRSITLCFPEYRVFSSAIVGGHLSIALGVALGIRRNPNIGFLSPIPFVHVFLGDMTERTGVYREVVEYAYGHALPINFIIEDNGKSVLTTTYDVWGTSTHVTLQGRRYVYELPWPHAGAGVRVQF